MKNIAILLFLECNLLDEVSATFKLDNFSHTNFCCLLWKPGIKICNDAKDVAAKLHFCCRINTVCVRLPTVVNKQLSSSIQHTGLTV